MPTTKKTPAKKASPPPPKREGYKVHNIEIFVLVLVLVALIVSGIWVYVDNELALMRSKVNNASTQQTGSAEVARLADEVARLRGQNAKLQRRIKAVSSDVAMQSNKQLAVQDRAIASLKTEQQKLEERLNTAKNAERMQPVFVAFTTLQHQLNMGSAYAVELKLFKKHAPEGASINKYLRILEEDAQRGVPTLRGLQEGFDQIKLKAIRTAALEGKPEGVWRNIIEKLFTLVTIRALEAPEKTSAEAVRKIEIAMEHGNVREALKHSGGLKGDTAHVMGKWINALQTYHAAQEALAVIYKHLENQVQGVDKAKAPRASATIDKRK
jgi:hypothetical protein